jgi:hypothetical protein
VGGAGIEVRFGVVVRALVLVFDEEGDGGAEGDAVLGSRLEVDCVFFIALCMGSG